MPANELFKLYTLGEKDFNHSTPIEAKLLIAKREVTKPDRVTMPDGPMFLIPLGFTILWAILAVLILSDIWKNALYRKGTIKYFSKVPCKNCRFFTNNPYLKCAVHPSTALTDQALNCSDYSPQDEDC